ncbi:MAG: helix-turn-helix transcriptional regulator [Pseudomonadota bacterium]
MDEIRSVAALAALAQAQRLRAFKALVVAGPAGMTPSVIAAQLGMAPNALSFHLKELAHAGLVTSESRGRNLIYRANFETMNDLLGYLTEHCCAGAACEASTPGHCTTATERAIS